MKAILEFDLPEDKSNHEVAVHSMGFTLVLWNYDKWLKNARCRNLEDDVDIITARDKLHELMEDHGVSLDMIE